jgi:hypothetical protein
MEELQKLADTLELNKLLPDKPDARLIALQHWYPRIWDEWAMGRDGATPDNLSSLSDELSFPDVKDTVTFNLVKPNFIAERFSETPRFANEIYPKFYGLGEDFLADVLPYDHGQEVLLAAGGDFLFLGDEFRIGRTGLIHLIKWNQRARWRLPLAEDVFFAWLKDKGFAAELSPCGRLAKQMYSHLGGWLSVLANEALLALFERMSKGGDEGKGLPLGAVKNELKSIGSGMPALYQSLVNRGVFQLGYKKRYARIADAGPGTGWQNSLLILSARFAIDRLMQLVPWTVPTREPGTSRPRVRLALVTLRTEVTQCCLL